MSRFVEYFKKNKAPALLSLLVMFLLVPMTVTLGKYVKEQHLGEISLEVKAEPAILVPGEEFKAMFTSTIA